MQKARRHPGRCKHRPNGAPTACKRMVSGTISLAYKAFFSPFPHGTGPLSVMSEYLALPDGAGSFSRDFSGPMILRIPAEACCLTSTGLSPSSALLSSQLRLQLQASYCRSYNPAAAETTAV